MAELLGIIKIIATADTLDKVIGVVRQCARSLVNSDGVSFVLREGDQCFYAEEDAIAPLWKGSRFPLEACASGWVMLNVQIAVIPNIYSDIRVPHEAYRPTFVKSMAMVPVPQDNPVAAIGAYWGELHEALGRAIHAAGHRERRRNGAEEHALLH